MVQYFPIVTGSLTVTGSVNVSGSITTNSTITATTLVVQTITSSISAITGSTNFGSLSTNTHTFTGSLLISGSNVLIGTPTSNGFRFKVSNNGAEEWALNPGDSTNVNNHVNYNRNTSAYIGANYSAATHSFLQGNVGIGTSSPSTPLYVVGAMKSETGLYFNNTGANGAFVWQEANTPLRFATNDTERMRITSDGNLLIGSTSNPGQKLYVAGDIRGGRLFTYSGGNASDPIIAPADDTNTGIFYPAANTIAFTTNGVDRGRFNSLGYFKASSYTGYGDNNYHQFFQNIYGDWVAEFANNNATPYGLLLRYSNAAPRNSGAEMMYLNDTSGNVFKISSNGNVYNLNNVYTALSDIKLKENITDATPKLDKLMQVRIVNFNLKTDPNLKQIGVIAQELQEIFPGLIEENYDRDSDNKLNGETTLGVKYSVFVPMLIKAIQELTARVQELENK
jgi:hypothetical protein